MKTLALDPGHGLCGRPSRITSPEGVVIFNEAQEVWDISFALQAALKEARPDLNVLLTKNNAWDDPSLELRGLFAYDVRADFLLSIHTNAVAQERVHGPLFFAPGYDKLSRQIGETILYALKRPPGEYFDEETGQLKPMRRSLHTVSYAHPPPHGDWLRRPWNVLYPHMHRGTPCGLLECEYATNPEARAWLLGDGLREIVIACVAGLEALKDPETKAVDALLDLSMDERKPEGGGSIRG